MNIEAKPAIYLIFCLGNQKSYVGQSKSVKKRIAIHQARLRTRVHPNPHLQAAYDKYGVNLFVFRVLEYPEDTSTENMTAREQYWMDEFNCLDREKGFNLKEAGDAGLLSEESRKKISESSKGRVPANKGVPMSEETKRKISEAKKGWEPTEEHKAHLRQIGKKQSELNKGRVVSEETKLKMSKALKGKPIGPMSEEAKAKISKTRKAKQALLAEKLEEQENAA
jgi:group I intron endonuclease